MKVKYTGERDIDVPNSYKIFMDVLPGKVYEVLSVERGWYRIIDESEEDYLYPPENFEIVAEDDFKISSAQKNSN
ncbi:MAG: hypothetical protein IJS69_06915 [Selenomonadaceae bacterium]|nr:hypothetical protein [Selenomonadaceae bacterium]